MQDIIYLFCIARSDCLPEMAGSGVDGRSPIFLLNFLDIAAIVSSIPIEEFIGPAAESNLKDLSWIGPRACRHEEVIEQIMCHVPVLPIRFGTIFSSLERLGISLKEHYGAISRFLDHATEKEEWAVKGLLDRKKAEEIQYNALLAYEADNIASSPGMGYFREKKIRTGAEVALRGKIEKILNEIRNDLSRYAADLCERRLLSREATGSDLDMVINWAFFVPRSVKPNFLARIDRANKDYAGDGFVFEFTGPWPPYSFSPSLDTEAGQ